MRNIILRHIIQLPINVDFFFNFQVHEAVDNSFQTRLSLNIVAQAPVIYMPQHSLSNESLMIDFGRITLSNYFEFVNPSKVLPDTTIPVPDPGIMLEHMVVKLENLRLSR